MHFESAPAAGRRAPSSARSGATDWRRTSPTQSPAPTRVAPEDALLQNFVQTRMASERRDCASRHVGSGGSMYESEHFNLGAASNLQLGGQSSIARGGCDASSSGLWRGGACGCSSSHGSSLSASRPPSSGSRPPSGEATASRRSCPASPAGSSYSSASGYTQCAGAGGPRSLDFITPTAPAASGWEEEEGVFVALPAGRKLQVDILSTWGDPYYVGLAAIEAFDSAGLPVDLSAGRIWASPADINVLPECSDDPRVVSNLTDGVCATCNDNHLWLAPYTAGERNLLGIELPAPCRLSLVRVWNYNKSRIHSYRGARRIELRLDGALIFRGEINKACGNVVDAFACAESILFTLEPQTLTAIEAHDLCCHSPEHDSDAFRTERPHTPGAEAGALECRPRVIPSEVTAVAARPATSAGQREPAPRAAGFMPSLPPMQDYEVRLHPHGKQLVLLCESTWGDPHYLGLNGLELLSPEGTTIDLQRAAITADPIGVIALPGMHGDTRTVDKLLLGGDCAWGWLAPYSLGASASVTLTMPNTVTIGAVRIWNYAKTPARGVRSFQLLLDGALIFQGVLRAAPQRRADAALPPPATGSDYKVQTVLFTDNEALIDAERHHVYSSEELVEELQIFDNGVLANQVLPPSDRQARPMTACIRPGGRAA